MPKPERTVRVSGEVHVVEVVSRFRGKTNAYVADRTAVLAILDSARREVPLRWEADWHEVAPGIETQGEATSQRTTIAGRGHEVVTTGSIRIHRHACPVCIQFRDTSEYNDYDDWSLSTRDSREYWVRYEAQELRA